MPELPEVETIRAQLAEMIPGWTIAHVRLLEPAMMAPAERRRLRGLVRGRTFASPGRHGKFLLLPLTGDVWLTVHLGMTGRILVSSGRYVSHPHDRFVFRLVREGEKAWLVFRDPRKFGRLEVGESGPAARVALLGPDAWLGEWDAESLARRLQGRTAPIKALLLDQRILAGVGNIYADESLFEAGIAPGRPAGTLDEAEVGRLAHALRLILERGVQALGCSVADFVHVDGGMGSMQQELRAYRRQGQPCVRCGATMLRTVIAGRGTSYCPVCQT